MKTSSQLTRDKLYSRNDLMREFGITDATINTGVFRPSESSSVWLFVTRDKPSHATQYQDRLVGDNLFWEGQSAGRTDSLIIDHEINGLELMVFYRTRKDEHPDYAFRYEGRFRYRSHTPGNPAEKRPSRFTLTRCL